MKAVKLVLETGKKVKNCLWQQRGSTDFKQDVGGFVEVKCDYLCGRIQTECPQSL